MGSSGSGKTKCNLMLICCVYDVRPISLHDFVLKTIKRNPLLLLPVKYRSHHVDDFVTLQRVSSAIFFFFFFFFKGCGLLQS